MNQPDPKCFTPLSDCCGLQYGGICSHLDSVRIFLGPPCVSRNTMGSQAYGNYSGQGAPVATDEGGSLLAWGSLGGGARA